MCEGVGQRTIGPVAQFGTFAPDRSGRTTVTPGGRRQKEWTDMRRIVLVVAAMATALALWVPTTAGATAEVGCYVGCVAPTSVPVPPTGPAVHAVSVNPPAPSGSSSALGSSSLPFTGTDVIELALIALVLLAVGWALSRRRRTLS